MGKNREMACSLISSARSVISEWHLYRRNDNELIILPCVNLCTNFSSSSIVWESTPEERTASLTINPSRCGWKMEFWAVVAIVNTSDFLPSLSWFHRSLDTRFRSAANRNLQTLVFRSILTRAEHMDSHNCTVESETRSFFVNL